MDLNESRSRRARHWSALFLASIGIVLVGTIGRVAQLKTVPDPRLVEAMEHKDGTPAQYVKRGEPESRGAIYDRRGRVVAMDVSGHRLFMDPGFLYRESLKELEKT